MIFVPIDRLPDRGNTVCGLARAVNHSYEDELDIFMSLEMPIVRVELEDGEFKSASSAYGALKRAVRTSGLPVDALLRSGSVYLLRTDM